MLRAFRLALPLLAALAGCHRQDENVVRVAVIDGSAAPFETGARLSPAGALLKGATAEGLVGFDEQGRIVPALADRWIVTDDGQSYIFRLRDGAWGSSRAPGEAVRGALRAAIAAQAGTALGPSLAGIEDVRAMAGRVVELRLSRPQPDLLQVLALPEMGLAGRGAGTPMTMRRLGKGVLLTPLPPERRGLPAVDGWTDSVRSVRLVARDAATATADFAAGKLDAVLGGTFANLPRFGRLSLARARLRLDPVSGLFGLQVRAAQGLLASPAGREAIAKAIDRDALAATIGVPGWATTTRLVAPGAEGDSGLVDERWAGQPIAARQADAARTVAAWSKGRRQPIVLRIALPAGAGADALFGRLAADLGAIGVRLQRVDADEPAELALIDRVAISTRPLWFLGQLSCAANRAACSEEADALAERAAAATDPAAARDLAAQAEATLTRANTYLPLGVPVRWSLVAGDGAGFAPNRWAVHPLFRLALGEN